VIEPRLPSVQVMLSLVVKGGSWFSAGPITFQTERILHYAMYFFVGAALGVVGVQRFARAWYAWAALAAVSFWWVSHAFMEMLTTGASAGSAWGLAVSTGFVLACAATSVAMIGLFTRFVARRNRVLDSLRDNAYTIYVLHYACVTWLQYLLVGHDLPGLVKGTLVTAGALGLAWGCSRMLHLVLRARVGDARGRVRGAVAGPVGPG